MFYILFIVYAIYRGGFTVLHNRRMIYFINSIIVSFMVSIFSGFSLGKIYTYNVSYYIYMSVVVVVMSSTVAITVNNEMFILGFIENKHLISILFWPSAAVFGVLSLLFPFLLFSPTFSPDLFHILYFSQVVLQLYVLILLSILLILPNIVSPIDDNRSKKIIYKMDWSGTIGIIFYALVFQMLLRELVIMLTDGLPYQEFIILGIINIVLLIIILLLYSLLDSKRDKLLILTLKRPTGKIDLIAQEIRHLIEKGEVMMVVTPQPRLSKILPKKESIRLLVNSMIHNKEKVDEIMNSEAVKEILSTKQKESYQLQNIVEKINALCNPTIEVKLDEKIRINRIL